MPGALLSASAHTTATQKPFSNLLVVSWGAVGDDLRARLTPYFETIEVAAWRAAPTDDQLAAAEVILGLPRAKDIQHRAQVPKLKFVQLISAGSDHIINSPLWKEEGAESIKLATAAGVHTGPIPQYFIATTLALFHKLQEQILFSRTQQRWASDNDIADGHNLFIEELRGKTVGILGYGHIGREAARLAAAFGANILAANTSGTKKPQDGYIFPGTGDPDGSIPSGWYSTTNPKSLATFLSKSDVILLSLPSTPATHHILNSTTFAHLKPTAIVVNVGRGDAIDTNALVAALDAGKLGGAALDVTDPEPLTEGHTLFSRRDVIITPHMSGRTLKYSELATDIFIANLERLKEGKEPLNAVDPQRGY